MVTRKNNSNPQFKYFVKDLSQCEAETSGQALLNDSVTEVSGCKKDMSHIRVNKNMSIVESSGPLDSDDSPTPEPDPDCLIHAKDSGHSTPSLSITGVKLNIQNKSFDNHNLESRP